jgi:hypothetical protein
LAILLYLPVEEISGNHKTKHGLCPQAAGTSLVGGGQGSSPLYITYGMCNNVYVMGTWPDEYVRAQQVPSAGVEKAVGQKVFVW